MPAYKFLGFSEVLRSIGHGKPQKYKQADVLIHGTGGEKTTYNHDHFKGIAVGTNFVWDYDKKWPESGIVVISEDMIPAILQKDEDERIAAKEAYEKKKAENIATGRFKYWYTDFRDGKAENILETLSENYDEFWQVLVDILNENTRLGYNKPREVPLTVEQLKKDERNVEFMALAQPGDKLCWCSWNGGFLAYSAGPYLSRNDECVKSIAWIVS